MNNFERDKQPVGGCPHDSDDTTVYLLSSPANAARLLAAIADHRAGKNMEVHDLLSDDDIAPGEQPLGG